MRKKIFKLTFLLLISLVANPQLIAQNRVPNKLSFDGLVYGYHNDPGKLFGADKKIHLEGVLKNVQLEFIVADRVVSSDKTGKSGAFSGSLDLGKFYVVEFKKPGYAKGSFELDLRNIPDETAKSGLVFSGLELILNEYTGDKGKDPSLEFGKMYFDVAAEQFKFTAAKPNKKNVFVKRKHAGTPNELMQGSIISNRDNNTPLAIETNAPIVQKKPRKVTKIKPDEDISVVEDEVPKSVLSEKSKFKLSSLKKDVKFTSEDIAGRETEIADAWKELERDKKLAKTPEDLLVIEAREELLLAAERDLQKAKDIIALQEDQISSQRWVIILFIGLAIILLGFLFVVYRNYKEKSRTNAIIASKNKRITASINYASRIQQAILLSETEVASILPDSFIYYAPRDTVSGDFYWVAEVGGKVIVAAVDCTGHGVPGAFMSMIGNTLLNQIIREKNITKPGEILQNLHEETMAALRQDQSDPMSNQDGMDMAICSIDKGSGTVIFAGAMNPMFIVEGKEVETISGDKKGVGGGILSRKMRKMKGYTEHSVTLKKGSCFYLFSDGYMDQFGGPTGDEKFNLGRFKELLTDIHSNEMSEQKNKVESRIRDWQGSAEQLDDILLIGVRI